MSDYYANIDVKNISLLKNKVVLITGASGLIGSNIIAYLDYQNKKYHLNLKIIGIIRSTKELWFSRGKNIQYLKLNLAFQRLPKKMKFDYLIHCATYAQPKKFLQRPKETVLLNIATLFDLLDLAKKNHARFLYLSSAEIYGQADKEHIPTDESFPGLVNTLSDRAIYAESKRLAETICYTYLKIVDVKIARVLICYGPGVKYDDQRVISEFIKKAQNLKEIIMMDQGSALRTFIFISDAIEILLNILLNSKEIVYNVCGKESASIRGLAEKIALINSAKVSGQYSSQEISGTPKQSTLSNKKYLDEFKKRSFVRLEDGLKITSDWFKNIKNQ